MPEYRAYITGHLRQFIRALELKYSDDISAAAAAQQLLEDGHGVGIWQLDHKVAQFDRRPD